MVWLLCLNFEVLFWWAFGLDRGKLKWGLGFVDANQLLWVLILLNTSSSFRIL